MLGELFVNNVLKFKLDPHQEKMMAKAAEQKALQEKENAKNNKNS